MAGAAAIIQAVLRGVGGGFSGAAKGVGTAQVGSANTDHSSKFSDLGYESTNMGMDKVKEKIKSALSGSGKGGSTEVGDNDGSKVNTTNTSDTATVDSSASSDIAASSAGSDINLKDVYKDIDDKIIENFAKIVAIDFKYKPEAQNEYNGAYGVDSNEHIGIKAQDLQDNEATKGTVMENENGDLVVDTRHLTFADTAAIAELSRRVLALEEVVKELQNK